MPWRSRASGAIPGLPGGALGRDPPDGWNGWRDEVHKGRLEAFSDGVIAVIITILVLELRAPHGADWSAITPLVPAFISYVLSFIYLGIYWNNHHHLLQAATHISGAVL